MRRASEAGVRRGGRGAAADEHVAQPTEAGELAAVGGGDLHNLLDAPRGVPALRGAKRERAAAEPGGAVLPAAGAHPLGAEPAAVLDAEPPVAAAAVPVPTACAVPQRVLDERSGAGAVSPTTSAATASSTQVIALPLLIVCDCLASPGETTSGHEYFLVKDS